MSDKRLPEESRHFGRPAQRPENWPRQRVYEPCQEIIEQSQMTEFARRLQHVTGRAFPTYDALHCFCSQEFRVFWKQFLGWSKLKYDGDITSVCVGDEIENAVFFPDIRLNYAENLLAPSANDDAIAVIACHSADGRECVSRRELREKVFRLANALEGLGLSQGDRVVAILRNDADALAAALAVVALGATLSVAAPEMGVEAILARFAPLTPKLLLAHAAARAHDTGQPLGLRVAEVARHLPSLEAVIALDGDLPSPLPQAVLRLVELVSRGTAEKFHWKRFPFNHPLFIVFSSGTTGPPKCIVHGAGGTLLEHVKEHRLHCDLTRNDTMFFHTSCAWMMWNWQLSALATGVKLVLYDGPLHSAETLWAMVARENVTVFGTSAVYLKMCEDAGLLPTGNLTALRAVLSTGSILYDHQYHWMRYNVKPIPLQSISGGTDILGCFLLGNPNLPVYAGESQCKSLGLDVRAKANDPGLAEGVGELICANPFPSRPLGFFGDADGARFHDAYFAQNAGIWTHGDLIEFTGDGSARLHGRSDGVLNVHGNRIGPAEIYRVLQAFSQIEDALVVERRLGTGLEQNQMVLLLVLRRGKILDGELTGRIRRELAARNSSAHVPDLILNVPELPFTHSGKRSEAAARDAVNGTTVRNQAALRNPECLEAISAALRVQSGQRPGSPMGNGGSTLESLLTGLWEKLFGFSPIGLRDDFFELGGNSLHAASLVARVRALTGRDLSISIFLHASTIEQLAEAMRAGESGPAGLVVLREGKRERPLFILHSFASTLLELWALARAMECERAIYGIEARGLREGEVPHSSLENMAAEYIQQIRSIQPHGPYALAGFSFGGLIAFEMAQQLLQSQETIELVALVDTQVDERCLPFAARLAHQRNRLAIDIRELRDRSGRQVLAYAFLKLAHLADRLRLLAGKSPEHSGLDEQALGEFTLPPNMRRVRDGLRIAMAAYHPKPYAGKVTYFQATIPNPRLPNPVGFWRSICHGGLEVIEAPGAHSDLILQPGVVYVAAALDRLLEIKNPIRGLELTA
jgi:acetoacetyl-CoA synthetase